ncbi:MAG: hypothetical protein LC689_10565 [Myxococcales bacterium]|nr:hypothetical protein [Myxococcales bacterium]
MVDWSEPDWSIGFEVSTGFCVSVGWPLTSPGFEAALPVVLPVSGVVVLGAAGRWTLPLVSLLPEDGRDLSDEDGSDLSEEDGRALSDEDGELTLPLFEVEVLVSPLDEGCVMLLLLESLLEGRLELLL